MIRFSRPFAGAALLLVLAGFASAADPKPSKPTPEKTWELNFDKVAWDKVFDWLNRETGLKPQGPLPNLKGELTLKGAKPYRLGEVIDLVNEALEVPHGLRLVRAKGSSYFLHDRTKPVAADRLDQVPSEQVPLRGKTELVLTTLTFNKLSAKETASVAQTRLSRIGQVKVLEGNRLQIVDQASFILQLMRFLRKDGEWLVD
jgi:hypothetical protein